MTYLSVLRQTFTFTPKWTYDKIPSLAGKVVVITGGSGGLGKIQALEMAKKGAHVFIVGRSPEKTQAAVDEIQRASGNEKVEFLHADLLDLASVEKCADEFLARKLPLHILVNNAGIMLAPFALSKDGIETQFATNHFAHVVLTTKLLPAMAGLPEARIVNLSSIMHQHAPSCGIKMELLNDPARYNATTRYSETKVANILFTRSLQKKLDENGKGHIYVNAVHPGVVRTELTRFTLVGQKNTLGAIVSAIYNSLIISVEKGAITQTYVATSQEISEQKIKAKYFVPYATMERPTAISLTDELASECWTWTEKVLKEKYKSDWSWANYGL
ncbi:hypothetical protein BJ742DRAFT_833843 [Cladochytrium replicatum]|nr:hypothetical protein BJ742DRAFT_833843 [Cladochytrium replicatum]